MQKVVPAILTKDPSLLKDQLDALKNHTKWVQIDIMDGKFVPAVSVNISELGEASQFFNLEIHLMVKDPENYLEDCNAVGAKRVYFHLTGTKDPRVTLSLMEKYSFQRGIAINPETTVNQLAPYVKSADAVLILSVVPGEQGHEFIPSVTEKALQIRSFAPDVLIGMDGGIAKDNITKVFKGGVDYVAVGSSIWKTEDPIASLRELQEMVS
ncbi:ribulose-phosphate 3-epimerase [Patescibacteria group bacterium]|nr:ribulose-phosphate 3-epimerase [Patescibacteria group bacterium]